MSNDELNLATLAKIFADENAARTFLESKRWPNGEPVCPHCKSMSAYTITPKTGSKTRPGVWKCKECRKQFTVRVGTIFEDSHVPLRKWLMAIHLMTSSKKGISSHQISRELGVTIKTAWFITHRIREAMRKEPMASMLGTAGQTVEADESYVGGKPRKGTGPHKRGRGTKKTPVTVLVERNGNAIVRPVPRIDASELRGALRDMVDPSAKIVTDDFTSYRGVGRDFAGGHSIVRHSAGQYVNKAGEHTNTAESFFSLLKRGHYGTFHKLSKHHLHRYCDEFAFRWDHRKVTDGERMVAAIQGSEGKRLTYREPVLDNRGTDW